MNWTTYRQGREGHGNLPPATCKGREREEERSTESWHVLHLYQEQAEVACGPQEGRGMTPQHAARRSPWRDSKLRRPLRRHPFESPLSLHGCEMLSLRSILLAAANPLPLIVFGYLRRDLERVDRELVAESVEGGPCSTSGAWEVVVALWTHPPKRACSTGALFCSTAMLQSPFWAA